MKIRNRRLHTKIRKFTVTTVALLKKIVAKEGLPGRRVYQYSFKKGGYTASPTVKTDFTILVFRHDKEIGDLQEFRDCAKYILDNPVTLRSMGWRDDEGKPVKVPIRLVNFRILSSFLLTYLGQVDKVAFVDDVFEEVYMGFEEYVYKSVLPQQITTPLQGLSGNVGEVNFGNNLKLRRILDSEKVEYLRMQEIPLGRGVPGLDIARVEYTLETVDYRRKLTGTDASFATESFQDVVTTLRLFNSGRIDSHVIKRKPLLWEPTSGIGYSWGAYPQRGIFRGSFKLDKSEKLKLLRLWKRFKGFKKNVGAHVSGKYINLALKRFNLGLEQSQQQIESKMIDFFIAFEALCLPEAGELALRLSNRVAILLGKTDKESEKIRKFMIKAYRVRSKIVHGSEVSPIIIERKSFSVEDFIQRVEEYLRESLKSFIVLSKKYRKQEDIMRFLDKCLIDHRSRRKLRQTLRSHS